MDTKFGFEELKKRLVLARRETLVLLANQAQNFFVSTFKKQGIGGQPWKEVQRRTKGEKAYKYPKTKGLQRRTSPILIGAGFKIRGGTLRRTVSNMARTADIGNGRLRMVVDLKYATYLNEGTSDMVARPFVKQVPELTAMQKKKIEEIVTKVFQTK
jgi:hypothetical protein